MLHQLPSYYVLTMTCIFEWLKGEKCLKIIKNVKKNIKRKNTKNGIWQFFVFVCIKCITFFCVGQFYWRTTEMNYSQFELLYYNVNIYILVYWFSAYQFVRFIKKRQACIPIHGYKCTYEIYICSHPISHLLIKLVLNFYVCALFF